MTQENPIAHSIWQLKPWWCQPWSIVTTGILIPLLAWFITHLIWIVAPLSLLVMLWWIVFLYLVPKAYVSNLETEIHQ